MSLKHLHQLWASGEKTDTMPYLSPVNQNVYLKKIAKKVPIFAFFACFA